MLPPPKYRNNLASGMFYFGEGLRLILRPELRLYIIVPLLVNIALFVALTALALQYVDGLVTFATDQVPGILQPLAWIAVVIIFILGLIVYGYSFNIITNILAAPFYGLLAAKTEEILTGKAPPDESVFKMVLRTTGRELAKLWYFFTRGILVILVVSLLGVTPPFSLLAPIVGLAWSAWTMGIQYADYAADNNQLNFRSLRDCLWQRKYSAVGFGGVTMFCSVTPIVNIFAMPVAVVGGTLMWLRELKSCQMGACEL